MKTTVKKIWKWLNGKKTVFGTGAHIAWFISNMIFKDLTDSGQYWEGHAYIGTLTGTGLVHKSLKTETGKKIINSLKNNKL